MTKSGYVLNASQTAYAREVEAILDRLDEGAFHPVYVFASQAAGWTPEYCVSNGIELALDS
jgi:hypothetical protein